MSWDILKEEIYDKWKKYWFEVHPSQVAEYSWNYLFTGGKQIRPNLFCELWEYLSPGSKINAELAFAIECIHVASIILDDTPWMDNASERRNRKTLHCVFTPKKACVISYELMDIVRYIWVNNKPEWVSSEVWQNLLLTKLKRLVIGQKNDIEKRGSLIELASLKTGVLFELVAETVAYCVELDTPFWKEWGNQLGILFQWMDDWNDREQDLIQGTRNAFNEAYDFTLKGYAFLWKKIKKGIGPQWFGRKFGLFMESYFTDKLPNEFHTLITAIGEDNISISYINEFEIPEITVYNYKDNPSAVSSLISESTNKELSQEIMATISGRDICQMALNASKDFFTIPRLQTNLWYIDETQWQHLEEIKELLKRVKKY
jgi:hypothetical protein